MYVFWLSWAISLDRFVNCLHEIGLFLYDYKTEFKELYYTEWLTKLMFLTDVTLHWNTLNKKLQGRGKTIEVMFWLSKGFEIKIDILLHVLNMKNFYTSQNWKKMLGEEDFFEQTNWDFKFKYSWCYQSTSFTKISRF